MNFNIIEDEPAVLLDAKFAFINRAMADGRINIVNVIFAETNEDNNNDLIADIGPYQINRRQFKGLDANGLISGDIIDAYCRLLQVRNPRVYFFPTHFYNTMIYQLSEGINSHCVRTWFKNIQILNYELIIIPCILNNHWFLVTTNYLYREIKYYDSENNLGLEVTKNIFEWLKSMCIVRYNTELY